MLQRMVYGIERVHNTGLHYQGPRRPSSRLFRGPFACDHDSERQGRGLHCRAALPVDAQPAPSGVNVQRSKD